MIVIALLISSCSSNSIAPKKLYKVPPSDFDIEVKINGDKSGWNYQLVGENGSVKNVHENQIALSSRKVIKFSGTSKDVIRTCLIRESDQRVDKIPRNHKIKSNLKLDLIPGFKNEQTITSTESRTYTMSCFVDGSIEQLDIVKLIVN